MEPSLLPSRLPASPINSRKVREVSESTADMIRALVERGAHDDAQALATTLRELVEDRGKRERLGLAAKTLVRERFDAATNASRLVELLLSVARRPDD